MRIKIKAMTIEDIERRRAEIVEITDSPDFQERRRQDALPDRELALLDELEDLDFLQHGTSIAS